MNPQEWLILGLTAAFVTLCMWASRALEEHAKRDAQKKLHEQEANHQRSKTGYSPLTADDITSPADRKKRTP